MGHTARMSHHYRDDRTGRMPQNHHAVPSRGLPEEDSSSSERLDQREQQLTRARAPTYQWKVLFGRGWSDYAPKANDAIEKAYVAWKTNGGPAKVLLDNIYKDNSYWFDFNNPHGMRQIGYLNGKENSFRPITCARDIFGR